MQETGCSRTITRNCPLIQNHNPSSYTEPVRLYRTRSCRPTQNQNPSSYTEPEGVLLHRTRSCHPIQNQDMCSYTEPEAVLPHRTREETWRQDRTWAPPWVSTPRSGTHSELSSARPAAWPWCCPHCGPSLPWNKQTKAKQKC